MVTNQGGTMKVKLNLNKLKLAVITSGYSVNEIAEKTGLARQTISRILNNEQSVRPSTASKLAKALEVKVESIIIE